MGAKRVMIRFENVYKTYATGVEAVKNANLEIDKGDFVFIVGSSGSGKSTMIKMLLKELEPNSGRIYTALSTNEKFKNKQN